MKILKRLCTAKSVQSEAWKMLWYWRVVVAHLLSLLHQLFSQQHGVVWTAQEEGWCCVAVATGHWDRQDPCAYSSVFILPDGWYNYSKNKKEKAVKQVGRARWYVVCVAPIVSHYRYQRCQNGSREDCIYSFVEGLNIFTAFVQRDMGCVFCDLEDYWILQNVPWNRFHTVSLNSLEESVNYHITQKKRPSLGGHWNWRANNNN